MREFRPIAEGREKAEALRFEQSLGAAPIRDLFGLVEQLDEELLTVRRPMPGGPDTVMLRVRGRRLMVVNTHARVLRQQRFAAAHALGHLLFEGADHALTLHVDRVVLGDTSPAERRADSFAAHLLMPVTALRLRLAARDPVTWTREELVVLSVEFGISMRGLLWHIRQVLPLSDAGRRHLAAIPEPTADESTFIASRAGLWELVHEGRAARDAIGWPRRYVALAARAYDRGRLTRAELERLVGPELARDVVEVGRLAPAPTEMNPTVAGGWRRPGSDERLRGE